MSGDERLPKPAGERVVQSSLPPVETLLQNQAALGEIIMQPQHLCDRLVTASPDQVPADIETAVSDCRQRVINEIVMPEGQVKLAQEEVQRMHGLLLEGVSRMDQQVGGVGTKLEEAVSAIRSIWDDAVDIKQTAIAYLADPSAAMKNPQLAKSAVDKLRLMAERYGTGCGAIADSYRAARSQSEVLSSDVSAMDMQLEIGAERMAQKADEMSAKPESAIFPDVETAVTKRGALSLAEHQRSCEAEVSAKKDQVEEAGSATKQVDNSVQQLVENLANLSRLTGWPLPEDVHRAVEALVDSVADLSRGAPVRPESISPAVTAVSQLFGAIEAKASDALDPNTPKSHRNLLVSVSKRLAELKAQPILQK